MIQQQVRAARIGAGISARSLARLAGVARSDLERFEAGGNFTYEFLMKLLPHIPGLTELSIGPVRLTFPRAELRGAIAELLGTGQRVLTLLDETATHDEGAAGGEAGIATGAAFGDWLAAGRGEGKKHASELLALPSSRWDRWLCDTPAARTAHTFFALVDAAHELLPRDPDRARSIAGLVVLWVDVLGLLELPGDREAAGTLLRGRAWIELGQAWREIEAAQAALQAFERATRILAGESFAIERLTAARGAAFARHLLGESDEALRILRAGIPSFLERGDRRNAMLSRADEGTILLRRGDVESAASLLEEALRDAVALDDAWSTGRILRLLGYSAAMQHDPAAAIGFLTRALMVFDDHDLSNEVAPALSMLSDLLADAKDLAEARERMETIAKAFLDAGRPLQAGWVPLQIVEMLAMDAGHEDRACALACDLLRTFTGAGMTEQAMRALEYVAHVAEERKLTSDDAREAAEFFRRLKSDPKAVFVA